MEAIVEEVISKVLNNKHLSSEITQELILKAEEVIQKLSPKKNREKKYKDLSVALIKRSFYTFAESTISKIDSLEYRSYVYSIMVSLLASDRKFLEAEKIFFKIEDPAYREDAIGYLVRSFENVKEAENFLLRLKDPREKSFCKKMLN